MTYVVFESSVQDGDPVFKFLFAVGDIEYRCTNADYIIGDTAGSFMPVPISAGEFSNSREFQNSILPLKLPRTNEFARLYIGGVPDQVTTVTIWRSHRSDPDEEFRIFWQGRIVGVSVDRDEVQLECESIFSSMKRTGLYRRYQKGCPYALYGEGCEVPKYEFAEVLTITAIAGNSLTVAGADGFDAAYFRGGELELPNGVTRFITGHTGTSITMLRAVADLADLQDSNGEIQATFYPGCNHTVSHCKDRFDNLVNYGGFPFFASKNPFNNVSMY